ncbi:zf-HC2 domain-containing protein [Kitasatospora sp. NPDC057198]|uniref:zf-HC2 domain-containing protein n=1 Tax=Kitasatospora sp. NPDC057198 TaxID=3346046 RepID=UPI00363AC321
MSARREAAAEHPDPGLLTAYARAGLPAGLTAGRRDAVERHLDGCAHCRDALAGALPADEADTRWRRLSAALDRALDEPSRSPAERLLLRLGVPEYLARLAAATPVLRRSWLLASAVTLLFAALAARLSPGVSATALLLVAPLVPVAGVALSYGPAFDPLYEFALVAPLGALRLVLYRTAVVLLVGTLLAVPVALAAPARGLALFGWLLPSLAVTALTLALAARLGPARAARTAGVGWLAVVALAARGGAAGSLLLTGPGQGAALLAALLGAGLVAAGRHRFGQLPRGAAR